MKKFIEILQDIEKNRKQAEKVENAIKALNDENKTILQDAEKSKEEKIAILHEKESKVIKAYKKQEDLKLCRKYLLNNARIALYTENIEKVLRIFKKYSGKAIGEKTKEKIQEEIKAETNCYLYFNRDFSGRVDGFSISPINEKNRYCRDFDLQISTTYKDHEKIYILNENNKMNDISVSDLYLYDTGCGYIENIEKQVKDLRKAHQKALAAKKALENACNDFNALKVPGIEYKSAYKTFYNSII